MPVLPHGAHHAAVHEVQRGGACWQRKENEQFRGYGLYDEQAMGQPLKEFDDYINGESLDPAANQHSRSLPRQVRPTAGLLTTY